MGVWRERERERLWRLLLASRSLLSDTLRRSRLGDMTRHETREAQSAHHQLQPHIHETKIVRVLPV